MKHAAWSVVIPCRNAEATIERQLAALARQDLEAPFEVVVADNGSTDRSAELARAWADRIPGLTVVAASPAGINVARNAGVRGSSGDFLAFCDADDEADPSWLREISVAFEGDADLVGGSLDWSRLNPGFVEARGRLQAALPDSLGFLPWAEGSNFAMRRALWDALGGFDESYIHGGDEVEFAWRAQLAGFRIESVPTAIMHYAARPVARATFKQSLGFGRSHVRLYRQFRSKGMPASSTRSVIARWWWIATRAPRALGPGEPREAFLRRSGISLGRLQASVKLRTPYL